MLGCGRWCGCRLLAGQRGATGVREHPSDQRLVCQDTQVFSEAQASASPCPPASAWQGGDHGLSGSRRPSRAFQTGCRQNLRGFREKPSSWPPPRPNPQGHLCFFFFAQPELQVLLTDGPALTSRARELEDRPPLGGREPRPRWPRPLEDNGLFRGTLFTGFLPVAWRDGLFCWRGSDGGC